MDQNEAENSMKANSFYVAAFEGHTKIIEYMLDSKKTKIEHTNNHGATALYVAAQNGKYQTVLALVKGGADVNHANINNVTPLFMACQNNNLQCVKILLEHNADIHKAKFDGATPLYIACESGSVEIIKLLLSYKAKFVKIILFI
jgi:ankyrin repeat protein